MYRISIFLFLLIFHHSSGFSQPTFEPKDGDRIIYLGNALMENEQHYGFLEYLITSRHPEKHLSFRNLGWSGDTVFGDARSYYTNPPSAFDLLINQIKSSQADWAILAYGSIEAQSGPEKLGDFEKGLTRLLDSLEAINTKAVLVSSIPQFLHNEAKSADGYAKDLRSYNQRMARIAGERGLLYLDIFERFEIAKQADLWEPNGIHLNQKGYLMLARTLGEKMGLKPQSTDILINIRQKSLTSDNETKVLDGDFKSGRLEFTINGNRLPELTFPEHFKGPKISIQGLKKGYYQLFLDGKLLAVADQSTWEEGLNLDFSQTGKQLLDLIREKDQIYFQQYRPQNRTYILGFRSYEQGRHKAGLQSLDALIFWLDGKINRGKDPGEQRFTLLPLP
ncbi:Lysophospholipase L1 [Cyclobacterium lianum]|uniref:Lysophospholipase L1 n=1 Tax=Cyclobacterium lianum TaxID=388280 RepID=A0A1M7M094_9BACT|nr:GDSL-type esterase/lipase family protein [Cyclobacterium lianum]SHM84046.1 Lysophospholipase L1 [Cyclobacterium lianum]